MKPSPDILLYFTTLGDDKNVADAQRRFQAKVKHFRGMLAISPVMWPSLRRQMMFMTFGCHLMMPEHVRELEDFLGAL